MLSCFLCSHFLQYCVSLGWLSLNGIYSQSHCYIACLLLPSKLRLHYHWYFCSTHHDLSSCRLSWDFASMHQFSCIKDSLFSIYGPCSAFWVWLFLLHSLGNQTYTHTTLFFCNRQVTEKHMKKNMWRKTYPNMRLQSTALKSSCCFIWNNSERKVCN